MEDCIKYMDNFEMEIIALEGLMKRTDDIKMQQLLEIEVSNKKTLLSKYRSVLSNISSNDICCRLFAKILGGLPPTKAVEDVAKENYYRDIKPNSLSAIWRYYSKIKDLLE
jgi:hypothetical protein